MVVKMVNKLIFSALMSLIVMNSSSFAQGSTDEFLEGGDARISSSHLKQMLESPDKILTEGGRTFKLVNPHISKDLLKEIDEMGRNILGVWNPGSEGNSWHFTYDTAIYDKNGNFMWSLHNGHIGEHIDFTIVEENPSRGFYNLGSHY